MSELSERIRRQVVATRAYLVDNRIDPHFADVLLSHYLDFAGEVEALDAARAEGPQPSYDGSKSLGERLFDAISTVFPSNVKWADLPSDLQAKHEGTALNFTARLSDKGGDR